MFLSFVAIAIHFLLLSVGFVVVHAPALPAIIRFRPVAVRHCCHHNIASHAEYCMIESTALILGIFILSPFNNKMKNCAKKKKNQIIHFVLARNCLSAALFLPFHCTNRNKNTRMAKRKMRLKCDGRRRQSRNMKRECSI